MLRESTWSSRLVGSKVWLSVQQLRDAATINRKWFNMFYTTAIDWTRGIPAALGLLAFISLPHRCPDPLSTAALVLHQAPAWGDCINQNVKRVTTSVAAVVASFWTTAGLTEDEWETLCFHHSTRIWWEPSVTFGCLITDSQSGLAAELFVLAEANKLLSKQTDNNLYFITVNSAYVQFVELTAISPSSSCCCPEYHHRCDELWPHYTREDPPSRVVSWLRTLKGDDMKLVSTISVPKEDFFFLYLQLIWLFMWPKQ